MTSFGYMLLDAVRIGLSACVSNRKVPHPDSSRQRKAVLEARSRREARRLKAKRNTWMPTLPVTGRWHDGLQFLFETDYQEYKNNFYVRGSITGRWISKEPNFVEVEKARRWWQVGGGNGRAR